MAIENIARFFNAVVTDKALAEKTAALAVENGFEFTPEELLEAGPAGPIDDAALEDAAGGYSEAEYMIEASKAMRKKYGIR